MSVKEILKSLQFGQVKQLIIWFFKHPLFLLATLFATLQTLQIAQREFPYIHGKHNKANAFRHALWNILIAKRCKNFSKKITKVLQWTTTFTDWHENFVMNSELPKLMDLHNNAVGRKLFLAWKDENTKTILYLLKLELKNAKCISVKEQLNQVKNRLVYLE